MRDPCLSQGSRVASGTTPGWTTLLSILTDSSRDSIRSHVVETTQQLQAPPL